jgi:myosin-5
MNPFQRLPLYTEETLSDYRANGMLRATEENGTTEHVEQLPPHVFATADAAYRCMMDDDLSLGLVSRNQSVLVSGESGAGKTETTKLVLRYLSAVGRPRAALSGEHGPRPHLGTLADAHSADTAAAGASGASAASSAPAKRPSVEKAVLQSNPVLEALGNAKTTRNENSSRFGKFIVMQFNTAGVLGGASVDTYLLEKVRLVRQAAGERNYHIFYQLHAGLPDKALTSLQLRGVDQHALTRDSGTYALRGISDADVFGETVSAMTTMGLDDSQQGRLWRVLAGLLHLGDLTFDPDSGGSGAARGAAAGSAAEGSCMAPAAIESAKTAARLLGFLGDEGDLRHGADAIGSALTGKSIKVGMDKIRTLFSPAQAHSATMSLIKDIYGKVFDWLVRRVNERIETGGAKRAELFIGVLDIFGFEHFEHNSFEQLCINFANEQLQQHFNAFMFKLEQEEYQREGIDWSDIQFVDNQDCLDLIEGRKPPGILALVDEQCSLMPKAPKGGDKRTEEEKSQELAAKLMAKLNETLGSSKGRTAAAGTGHARFLCTPKMQRDSCFVVRHYAGEVEYECVGFVEKNADQVHAEALALARESTNPVVYEAYREAEEAEEEAAAAAAASGSAGSRRKKSSKETVGGQFKRQLAELMRVVRATTPHYIRCIKPNSDQVPVKLERISVVSQLRCGGVLEAVRVARLGFPVRLPHHKLLSDYAAISPPERAIDGDATSAAAGVGSGPLAEGPGSRAIELRKLVLKATAEDADGAHDDEDGVYDQDLADAAAETARQLSDALRDEAGGFLSGLSFLDRGTYQVGSTKVFLRKSAFDALQIALNEAHARHTVTLQCAWRVAAARFQASRRRAALLSVQCAWRSRQARITMRQLRRDRAAVCMASFGKMLAARLAFQRSRRAATLLRAQFLRRKQRAWYLRERRRLAATLLQAWRRSAVSRAWFLQQRRAAVSLQCFARVSASKVRLEQLRKEAREVGNLRETNVVLRQRSRALEGKVTALVDMLTLQLGARRIEWGRQALPGGDALSSTFAAQPSDTGEEQDADDGRRASAMPSGFAVVLSAPDDASAAAGAITHAAVDAIGLARALREASSRANTAVEKLHAATAPSRSQPSSDAAVSPTVRPAPPASETAEAKAQLAEIQQLREQLQLARAALRKQQQMGAAASAASSTEAPTPEAGPDPASTSTLAASDEHTAPAAASAEPAAEGAARRLQEELELARRTIATQQEDMAAWKQRVMAAERRAAELETQEAGDAARASQAEAAAKTAAAGDTARLAAEQRQELKLRKAQSQTKATTMQLAKVEMEMAALRKQAQQDRLAKAELAHELAALQRRAQSSQEDTVRMYQGELDKLAAVCDKARDRYSLANSAALKMQEALRAAQARTDTIAADHAKLTAMIASLEDDLSTHKQQRAIDMRSKRMLIERADNAKASRMATEDLLHTAELRVERVERMLSLTTSQAAAMEDLLRLHGIDPGSAGHYGAGGEDAAAGAAAESAAQHSVPEMSPMVSTGGRQVPASAAATAARKPSRLGAVAMAVSTESQASDGSGMTTPGGTKKRRKRNKKKSKKAAAASGASSLASGPGASPAAAEDDESAMTAISGVLSSAFKAGFALFSSPAAAPAAAAPARPAPGRGGARKGPRGKR